MNLSWILSFLWGIFLASLIPALIFGYIGVRLRLYTWLQFGKAMFGAYILLLLIIPSMFALSDWLQAQSVSPELATLVIMVFIITTTIAAALRLPFFRHNGRRTSKASSTIPVMPYPPPPPPPNPSQIKYCVNCGTTLAIESLCCGRCGARQP